MSVPSIDGVAPSPPDRSIERTVRDNQIAAYGADGPAASDLDRKPQAPTRLEASGKQDDRYQADQDRADREDEAVRAAISEESLSRLREASVAGQARSTLLDKL